MRTRRALATLLIVAGGCTAGDAHRLHGVPVSPPRPKPDVQLTSTDGEPFALRERTTGTVTLLFIGYTHCPDVCPVHLANIAAVLDRLPATERARVNVVFVTADPARDTPRRLRAWLDTFSPSFVGLRGTPEALRQLQTSLASSTAAPAPATASASDQVGHPAQVFAFTPDDSLRVMYPFGVRQRDWAEDIPRLLAAR